MAGFDNNKFNFEDDMRHAVYNAITDVLFKYRNYDFAQSEEQITAAVDHAVDWWDAHFFEDEFEDEDDEL